MFSITDIINLAIRIEQNGEAVYQKARAEISDPAIGDLLQWMADQEHEHIQWFTELYSKLAETSYDLVADEMGRALLTDVLGKQSFALEKRLIVRMVKTPEILAHSIEFEKDTVLFYETLRPFLKDEADQRHMDAIIAEEKRHVRTLQEMLDKNGVFLKP